MLDSSTSGPLGRWEKHSFSQLEKDGVLGEQKKIRGKGTAGEKRTRNGPQKSTTVPRVSCPGSTEEK